jgi:hypothetical protein
MLSRLDREAPEEPKGSGRSPLPGVWDAWCGEYYPWERKVILSRAKGIIPGPSQVRGGLYPPRRSLFHYYVEKHRKNSTILIRTPILATRRNGRGPDSSLVRA